MDKRLIEAVFAVFTCILVGPFIGWYLEKFWEWHWLPAVLASMAGSGFAVHLACDIPGLKIAFPNALKYAKASSTWGMSKSAKRRWRLFFQLVPLILLAATVYGLWGAGLTALGEYADMRRNPGQISGSTILRDATQCFLFTVVFTVVIGLSALGDAVRPCKGRKAGNYRILRNLAWSLSITYSPIALVCYWPLRGLYLAIVYTPSALGFAGESFNLAGRFLLKIYLLTHCRSRVLALADTALFIGTFYFTYSPIGALIAAALGALWFRINYVYVRPWALTRLHA